MGIARGEEGERCRPRVVGVQATKASMSQNVDRERRVPLPLSSRLSSTTKRPLGSIALPKTRGDDYGSVTVRVRPVRRCTIVSPSGETCRETSINVRVKPIVLRQRFLGMCL